jgi:hypothetical protein
MNSSVQEPKTSDAGSHPRVTTGAHKWKIEPCDWHHDQAEEQATSLGCAQEKTKLHRRLSTWEIRPVHFGLGTETGATAVHTKTTSALLLEEATTVKNPCWFPLQTENERSRNESW